MFLMVFHLQSLVHYTPKPCFNYSDPCVALTWRVEVKLNEPLRLRDYGSGSVSVSFPDIQIEAACFLEFTVCRADRDQKVEPDTV